MGIGAGFITLILFRRDLHTVSSNRIMSFETHCHLKTSNIFIWIDTHYICTKSTQFEYVNKNVHILLYFNQKLLFFEQIAFFIGTLVNEVSNVILKHWIREPRPVNRVHIGTEFGMPSSHSQFIWFFSTYVTLFIFIRYTIFWFDTNIFLDISTKTWYFKAASHKQQYFTAAGARGSTISFSVLLAFDCACMFR